MNKICENKIDLKFKELRLSYWEQFHKLPSGQEVSNVKLLLAEQLTC